MVSEDEIAHALEQAHDFAKTHGWRVNPANDFKVARGILKMTLKAKAETGIPYCPCKPDQRGQQVTTSSGIRYRSACPCVDAIDEIAAKGHCCCNLYTAS